MKWLRFIGQWGGLLVAAWVWGQYQVVVDRVTTLNAYHELWMREDAMVGLELTKIAQRLKKLEHPLWFKIR